MFSVITSIRDLKSFLSIMPLEIISLDNLITVLGSDQYLIRGKQNFITRRVHTVQHAVKVVEALGARVEAEVGAGRDHTQDPQELSQDQDLVQEALIIVEIEVAVA